MGKSNVPCRIARTSQLASYVRAARNYMKTCAFQEFPPMSAPLVVSIPHQLGREEATRRLKGSLTRAAASLPVLQVDEERWEGDRMLFRVRALGQLASGQVDVSDDHVRLEVTLPWLLQRFASAAQAAIRSHGQLLLSKKS